MKRLIFAVIIYIILVIIFHTTTACDVFCDHDCRVDKEFPKLIPPVVLVAKECTWAGCSAMVQDSTGKILHMGNLSTIGRMVGSSYEVGDTIEIKYP